MEVISSGRRKKEAGSGAMQLAGCNRIHEEVAARRTGATTPRERMPKRRRKATQNNGGYSTAFIAAEAQRGMHLIRKPAKLTGTRNEICTWAEPTRPGVVSPSRKRHTQYVER